MYEKLAVKSVCRVGKRKRVSPDWRVDCEQIL